jgi:hypothetical protein
MIGWIIGLGVLAGFGYYNRARFQLGCWLFDESVDEVLDTLLNRCLDSGITGYSTIQDSYGIKITFENGKEMTAWNGNKYYSWLKLGVIDNYRWRDARPKAETMVRLREAIKQYHVNE